MAPLVGYALRVSAGRPPDQEGTGQPVMRQPGAEARGFRADGGGAWLQGLGPDDAAAGQPGPREVPPPRRADRDPGVGQEPERGHEPGRGQEAERGRDQPERDPAEPGPPRLPPGQYVQASMPVLRAVPPSAVATHVMVWADFGYGANLPIGSLAESRTLLATHRDGRELTPEQGYPVRLVVPSRYGWKNVKWVRAIEYLAGDRRGFWEERGYHNNADPWREQRYSYQEQPGEGPEL